MKKIAGVAILVLLGGLAIGATYLVQTGTAGRIEAQRQAIANRTLLDILPPDRYDNQPMAQPLIAAPVALPRSTLLGAYLATRDAVPSAVLLSSQVQGYEGSIELLIAVDPTGRVLGVKILRQSETPGLGAAIAGWPNAWLQTFEGKSSQVPADESWALKKDHGQFDQLAGATVTSRAVLQAVHDALRYFDGHKTQLTGAISHE
ncbi:RnfABCDGE type electron transport complex subunit G [Pseudomonas sp. D1-2]|uniref:RnfABCDGE type electron transport complex subunit G n=1 Tax=unclassified Pseudomonas TaxID=196821 RepID=UPI003DA8DA9A